MNQSRRVSLSDPRQFGRRSPFVMALPAPAPALSADLKLFASTFAAGLLFMSVYLA